MEQSISHSLEVERAELALRLQPPVKIDAVLDLPRVGKGKRSL